MSDVNRRIKIYIDGSNVASESAKVRRSITSIEQQILSLDKSSENYNKQLTKLKGKLDGQWSALNNYHKKLEKTARVLKNVSGASYEELIAVRKNLVQELRNAIPGTERYNRALEHHRAVSRQVVLVQREMTTEIGCQGTAFGKLAHFTNRYIGLIGGVMAVVTGVTLSLRGMAENAAKMDDAYADVQKTTQMTREEVVALNDEFKKLDTRTSREELNALAADAGKLGLSGKKDVLDFVDAGNQIRVAFKGDLGEDAIKDIGKITDIYRKSTGELEGLDLRGKMLAVGSAINELGQSSTASEGYMVDFTKRLGGVASQAGISVQDILGYASALDQSGQAVEMSATAFQTFLMKVMGDPAKFARLAGIEIEHFNNLLRTDTNAAIIEVLTSLNRQGGFQQLIPVFQEMGLDGARATGVLSAMATNIDKVTQAQQIANTAFAEGTSVTNEYATKNNNLMAEMEKARKEFKDNMIKLGQELAPVMIAGSGAVATLANGLGTVAIFAVRNITTLSVLAGVIGTYWLALKTAHYWQELKNGEMLKAITIGGAKRKMLYVNTVAVRAYNVAIATGTGGIKAFVIALRAMFVAMGLNPIGWLVVGVTALVVWLAKLALSTTEAERSQKAMNDAYKEAEAGAMAEQRELAKLKGQLAGAKKGSEEYLKIKNKIVTDYGKYDANLASEIEKVGFLDGTYQRLSESIMQAANVRQFSKFKQGEEVEFDKNLSKKFDDIYDKMIEKYGDEIGSKYYTQLRNAILTGEELNSEIYGVVNSGYGLFNKGLAGKVKELRTLKKEHETSLAKAEVKFGIQKNSPSPGDGYQPQEGDEKMIDGRLCKFSGGEWVIQPPVADPAKMESAKQDRIKQIELEQAEEKLAITRMYDQGVVNKERYLKMLEWLELDSLNRKLAVLGLEKEKRIQIEQQIIDAQIKMKQEAEKPNGDLLKGKNYLDEMVTSPGVRVNKSAVELAQQDAELIQKINEKAGKGLARFNEQLRVDQEAQLKAQEARIKKYEEITSGVVGGISSILGGFAGDTKTAMADLGYDVLMLSLDTLKQLVRIYSVEITAFMMAKLGPVPGAIAAAAGIAVINGLVDGVKGSIKRPSTDMSTDDVDNGVRSVSGSRVVTQQAAGKYDVIGESDGKLYRSVPYLGEARTGVATHPVLVGEQGDELVISAPDFLALQKHMNYPLIIDAIRDVRGQAPVRQYADGKYDTTTDLTSPSVTASPADTRLAILLAKLEKILSRLDKNGLNAYLSQTEMDKSQTRKRLSDDPFTRKKI